MGVFAPILKMTSTSSAPERGLDSQKASSATLFLFFQPGIAMYIDGRPISSSVEAQNQGSDMASLTPLKKKKVIALQPAQCILLWPSVSQ